MNKEEYIKKIQKISSVFENAKCVEDVLNTKVIDIKEDFQYICLNSSSNRELVNELIVRLAQNGNRSIIEDNVKIITMNTWKDVFNRNEAIKSIFIDNFDVIYKNTSILNYRELERFVEDENVCKYVYSNMPDIINKLSTYDRASLINLLNSRANGSSIVKENLEYFFKKGYYNITTAYAKITKALDKTPGISKLDILRACNSELPKMLSRETAIDNETNKLLSWVYDAFEETKMDDDERASIKKNIDIAIEQNFQEILEKSNYDRETIKILKQFDCTREQFEKSKNYFIEKSHTCEIIPYKSDAEKKNDGEEQNNIGFSGNTEKVLVGLWSNLNQKDRKSREEITELQENSEIEESGCTEKIDQDNINCIQEEKVHIENEIEETSVIIEDGIQGELCEEFDNDEMKEADRLHMSSKDFIDSYIKKYAAKRNDCTEVSLDERLEKILVSNVEETNKIIDRVLDRKTKDTAKKENVCAIHNHEEIENATENTEVVANNKIATDVNVTVQDILKDSNSKEETALAVTDQQLEYHENKSIFMRIWEKIIKLFKRYDSVDRIGE